MSAVSGPDGPSPAAAGSLPVSDLTAPPVARRMAAWLYEGILLFGVVFMADYLFSSLSQTRNALDNRVPQMAFIFIVLGMYFTWFWSRGQTLAMKTWNIRVVDAAGRPLTQARAALRYVLSWLWVLPPLALSAPFRPLRTAGEAWLFFACFIGWIVLWALFTRWQPRGQFWHDVLAGTRLIHWKPAPR